MHQRGRIGRTSATAIAFSLLVSGAAAPAIGQTVVLQQLARRPPGHLDRAGR